MLELTPLLDPEGSEPLYVQLYAYVREEIRGQRLRRGSRLPAQRSLAQHLGLSRNTVDAAYQQLLAEGYVYSEARKGLFVADLPDEILPIGARTIPGPTTDSLQSDSLQSNVSRSALFQPAPSRASASAANADTHAHPHPGPHQTEQETEPPAPICDFRYGDVDTEHFPFKAWRTFAARALSAEHADLLLYGEARGERDLRMRIAEYLYQARGVACRVEQIVIGAGTPYLLDLLRRLIGDGGRYAMEDPGYARARRVLEQTGRAVASIPLDEHGIRVDLLTKADANAVYVTPSHQFPLGMIMPAARRLELIRWARERGGTILEDDYDSEFRYEGRPVPSLHSLDPYGNTVYMGTFSKSWMPSARVGYVALPEKLLPAYREHEELFKQTVPRTEQHTLALFMESGEWERHLNRMRQLYKKRHAALLEAVRREWQGEVRVIGSAAGLHVMLELGGALSELSEKNAIEAARRSGVIVYGGSAFRQVPAPREPVRLLLGFAGLDEAKIKRGIRRLRQAWAGSV